jgi:phospholipase D1/2
MGTHDEETEQFFAGTPVTVANVGRANVDWGGIVYTHHQKTVVLDRGDRVVSYLGGIDLTDGRFDTPEYPLFDYAAQHGEDFYQNCTLGASAETGPREPWHDIHARLEGPAAMDVLANFEDRWRRQAEVDVGF